MDSPWEEIKKFYFGYPTALETQEAFVGLHTLIPEC
jgi:hypothetical protein